MPKASAPAIKPSGSVSTPLKLLSLTGIAGVSVLAGLVSGSLAAGLMFLVIGLFAYRGLSQGLSGGIATVLALILASLLGPLLGGLIAPILESSFQVTGLVGRGLALGIGGMIVFAAAAAILRVVIRRALKDRKILQRADAAIGAVIGGLVGTLVAFVGAWIVLSLAPPQATTVVAAPVAQPNADSDAEEEAEPSARNRALEVLQSVAADLRGSSIGAAAQATLPGDQARIFTLMSDFAFVARDPIARQHLVESEVVKQIWALPAAAQAAEKAKADPQLRHIIEAGGITPEDIRIIAQSKTITEIIDSTDFMGQVTPLLPQLEEEIRKAKEVVGAKSPG